MIICTLAHFDNWKILPDDFVYYSLYYSDQLTFISPYQLASVFQLVTLAETDEVTLGWILVTRLHYDYYY